ncbi:uncharacterized protein LOC116252685 [Nymphaea colorata]|nr:uncharacterized protein LOC116252685 [Nymphaea colorata]XP_031482980.1 uncharacterized protein LOC116252685 [Nymphaea colorata]XP_031482981.1 uncharacterized protein LOC116252685 [Nymphaea colorata]
MAALLEVFPVHRPSASAAVLSSPSRTPFRKAISLPATRGLRLVSRPVRVCTEVPLGRRKRSGAVVCEVPDTAIKVPLVNESTWQSLVIEEEGPVLVEFWAPWCGPCRMIEPVVSELAVQYAGKLKFYKLNTDESPKIATQYGIRSIPTVMIFRGGEKKEAIIGAVPKTTLTLSIEKFLP